ncbi:hypothetical protein Bmyc01_33790 [Bacillus mycoides]|nr:hypothetical protein Bmyc01_33790 [Bacillus mycoides]
MYELSMVNNLAEYNLILSRYLPGSKTPTSQFSECKEVRWEPGCP